MKHRAVETMGVSLCTLGDEVRAHRAQGVPAFGQDVDHVHRHAPGQRGHQRLHR